MSSDDGLSMATRRMNEEYQKRKAKQEAEGRREGLYWVDYVTVGGKRQKVSSYIESE